MRIDGKPEARISEDATLLAVDARKVAAIANALAV